MPKLRVHNFAISVDGYGAGPSQSLDNPLGVGGPQLHEWVDWWNQRRLHSADGDLPPAEYEALYYGERDTTDVA